MEKKGRKLKGNEGKMGQEAENHSILGLEEFQSQNKLILSILPIFGLEPTKNWSRLVEID